MVASYQLPGRILFSRLPALQRFLRVSGKDPDACQGRGGSIFPPVELRRNFPLARWQLYAELPIDGCQFHGLPPQLPQIIAGFFLPTSPNPLPDLLLQIQILFLQIRHLLIPV